MPGNVLNRPMFIQGYQRGGPTLPAQSLIPVPPQRKAPIPAPANPVAPITPAAPTPAVSPQGINPAQANDQIPKMTPGDNQVTMGIMNALQGLETFEEVMNLIRGDQKPVEARREELADVVGDQDAQTTPESVLTISQLGMKEITMANDVLDQGEEMQGITSLPEGEEALDMGQGALIGGEQIPQVPEMVSPGMAYGGMVPKYANGGIISTLPHYEHGGTHTVYPDNWGPTPYETTPINFAEQPAEDTGLGFGASEYQQDVIPEGGVTTKDVIPEREVTTEDVDKTKTDLPVAADTFDKLNWLNSIELSKPHAPATAPRGIMDSPTTRKIHNGKIYERDQEGVTRILDMEETKEFIKKYNTDKSIKGKQRLFVGKDGTIFNQKFNLPDKFKTGEYSGIFNIDEDTGKVSLKGDKKNVPANIKYWLNTKGIKVSPDGGLTKKGSAIYGGSEEDEQKLILDKGEPELVKEKDIPERLLKGDEESAARRLIDQYGTKSIKEHAIGIKKALTELDLIGPDVDADSMRLSGALFNWGMDILNKPSTGNLLQDVTRYGPEFSKEVIAIGAANVEAERDMNKIIASGAIERETAEVIANIQNQPPELKIATLVNSIKESNPQLAATVMELWYAGKTDELMKHRSDIIVAFLNQNPGLVDKKTGRIKPEFERLLDTMLAKAPGRPTPEKTAGKQDKAPEQHHDIVASFEKGKITEDKFRSDLKAQGYNNNDINMILNTLAKG